uniref:Uncharacterized protein n=1 Tax=Populus alba TaxID=43335 RepID=A0A4U5P6W4_POPAL|nr:hypothetical protein D5086_0000217820 [Populus alba]
MAIVNPNLLSIFSQFNFQEKSQTIIYRHPVLVFGVPSAHQAHFVLSPQTSRSPETLAGGPYTRDAIVGSSVVNVIPPMTRALVENMFPFMRLNTTCINDANHLFGARGRFSWSSPMGSFSRRLLQLLMPIGQDLEAFCLVDVVLYCCFIQSSLLRSLKLDISFGALFVVGLVDLFLDFHYL